MNARLLASLKHSVLGREEALDDYVEDARPEQVHVDVDLLQVLAEGR